MTSILFLALKTLRNLPSKKCNIYIYIYIFDHADTMPFSALPKSTHLQKRHSQKLTCRYQSPEPN